MEEARRQHGHTEVPINDTDFERIIEDVQEQFRQPPAPAMPLLEQDFDDENLAMLLQEIGDEEDQERAESILIALAAKTDDLHEDHFSQSGYASIEQYAMVHMPIPIN